MEEKINYILKDNDANKEIILTTIFSEYLESSIEKLLKNEWKINI